ncbi:MAG: lipopolysaccharide heptosyltransferase I [Acidobacteria bacterium]|nr:lipopolysaccharide heptosyltransferase I [Acidobacteriota bacterium]
MEPIAIVRLSSLGDIVHTLPAFQALRRAYPAARISWIAEPAGAALLKNFPGIDEVIPFELKSQRGLSGKLLYLLRFRRRWHRRFGLVLDFQGLIKSALLAFLLGGTRLGFGRCNAREPLAAAFYSRRAPVFPEERHVIHKNLHLLSLLGIAAPVVEYPQRPWTPSPRLAAYLEREGLAGGWTILNVGGGWPSKLLSAAQWLQVAAGLKSDHALVLLWGTEKEKATATEIARQSGARLAPFLEFGDLLAFIAGARLVISGDTLALHLADLTRTPAVGIFGPSSPERNGPLLPASRTVHRRLGCSFCYRRKCDTMDCLQGIVIEDIIQAARRIDAQRDRSFD